MPLRVLLAIGASLGLTAAIAIPMAYRASRADDEAARESSAEVMGTTVERDDLRRSGLYWSTDPEGDGEALHGAEIRRGAYVWLALDGVARVDFRVGDGPVETDREAPWQVNDGEPLDVEDLGTGSHSVTATVTFTDGRAEVRQARFVVGSD